LAHEQACHRPLPGGDIRYEYTGTPVKILHLPLRELPAPHVVAGHDGGMRRADGFRYTSGEPVNYVSSPASDAPHCGALRFAV